jgi:hypothetical protein
MRRLVWPAVLFALGLALGGLRWGDKTPLRVESDSKAERAASADPELPSPEALITDRQALLRLMREPSPARRAMQLLI